MAEYDIYYCRVNNMRACRSFILPITLIMLVWVLTACGQMAPPDKLVEGRPFPAVVLTGFDGERQALDDYRGRFVILNIWATWCPPCRAELPSLDRLNNALDPEKFVVIGLSVDSDRDIAWEFYRDRGVQFTSFIDPDGKISKDILGIRVYPDTFLISPQGKLIRRIVGERVWDDPAMIDALNKAYAGDTALLEKI